MPSRPCRTLRVLLVLFSILITAEGLFLIVGSKSLVLRFFPHFPESEITTQLLIMAKQCGGLSLTLALMLYRSSRDPVRNVVIIDAFIAGLCLLAILPLLSLYTLDVRRLYPGYVFWGRPLWRLPLAALLYYLRPRETAPVGR
jgi:hypothetical protein